MLNLLLLPRLLVIKPRLLFQRLLRANDAMWIYDTTQTHLIAAFIEYTYLVLHRSAMPLHGCYHTGSLHRLIGTRGKALDDPSRFKRAFAQLGEDRERVARSATDEGRGVGRGASAFRLRLCAARELGASERRPLMNRMERCISALYCEFRSHKKREGSRRVERTIVKTRPPALAHPACTRARPGISARPR